MPEYGNDRDNEKVKYEFLFIKPTGDTWQHYHHEYIVPRNSEKLQIRFLIYNHPGTTWIDSVLFYHLNLDQGGGALEIGALLCMPLLTALAWRRWARVYPLAFTAVLLGLVLNPLTFYAGFRIVREAGLF